MLFDEFPETLLTCQHHVSDAYEVPFTVERASLYGVGGIPDVRMDGVASIVGAGSPSGAYAAYRSAFMARMEQTGGVSPVSITGDFSHNGSTLSATASFRLVDPVVLADLRAYIVVLENGIVYGGSNKHVTRAGHSIPVTLTNVGDVVELNHDFTISGWNMNNVEVIAFIQTTSGNKAIHNGRDLPATADFSAYMAVRVAAIPEGNGEAEFTGTISNIGDVSDELTVTLEDTFGWPTAFMLEGEGGFHTAPSMVTLSPGEEIAFYLQVTTDADVRIGSGGVQVESGNTGTAMTMLARIFNGSPAILVVDDDANRNDEVFILDALDDIGYLYDDWDVFFEHGDTPPTAAEMFGYDAVLWTCGWRLVDQVTAVDAQNLMAYMDTGKGLVLISVNALAGSMPTAFVEDYLGVASWTNDVGADEIVGIPADPISDGIDFVMDYPHPTTNKADDMVPSAVGTVCMHNDLGDRVAMRADNGTARSVFFTFGVNAMTPAGPDPNNAATLLGRALDWVYQGDSQDLPWNETAPALSVIRGVTPNPVAQFGAGRGTTVQLSIAGAAADAALTLDLVDVNGRHVQRLHDGALPAGQHTVEWDGRDAAGRTLSSGMYYLKLHTSQGGHSAPVLVVR